MRTWAIAIDVPEAARVGRENLIDHDWLTVERGSELTVRITDNGVGLNGSARRGVGLDSMRERATELGGTCVIGPGETTGTEVSIRIPLPGPVAA